MYEDQITNSITGANSNDLRNCSHNPGSTLRYFFVIWPSPTDRGTFNKMFASRCVFELLWEQRLQYRIADMEYFYNQFRESETTAANAEWIFKPRVHQLFREE